MILFNLKVSKVSFLADKLARQILTPVTSIMCLKLKKAQQVLLPQIPLKLESESSAWQVAGKACVDYFSALATWLQRLGNGRAAAVGGSGDPQPEL